MKIKMLVSLLLLFLITSSWLIYRENPNNSYRAPGTSASAHKIRIDDQYYVNSISATYSSIIFDDNDGHYKSFTDLLVRLNWDDNYIVASYLVELNSKELNYLILNKDTHEVTTYLTINDFKTAMAEKDINLNLKRKHEFDWF